MRLDGVILIMLGAILTVLKVGRRISVAWTVLSTVLVIGQVLQSIRLGVAEAKKKPKRKQVARPD